MGRLTQFVLRHRRLIGLIWLLAVLVGGYASSVLSSHLSMSFEIPGTHSDIADSAIIARYAQWRQQRAARPGDQAAGWPDG